MSLLFKAGQVTLGTGRRTLAQENVASPPDQIETIEPEAVLAQIELTPSGQLDALRRQLAELEQAHAEALLHAEASERAAHQRGLEEGIESGMARAEHDHARQLDALDAGVGEALAAFRERLQDIEVIALDVTQAALQKVLGDSTAYTTLVEQTARHHLAQLATGSAIGIHVSGDDFPDSGQLHDAFAALIRNTALTLKVDPQLRSGACLIELTLGRLDVSLPQQMARITTTLDGLRTDD